MVLKEDGKVFVSTNELSDALGITRRWVYELENSKVLNKVNRDQWDLISNFQSFIKYRELLGTNTKERAEILKRKDLADARLKELTFKVKSNEYVPRVEIEKALEDLALILSSKLNSIPEEFSTRVRLTNSEISLLKELCDGALAELSKLGEQKEVIKLDSEALEQVSLQNQSEDMN